MQFAVGAEYRRDKMDYLVDDNTASADAAGTSGAVLPLQGSVDVKELFMEGRIPLVQDHKGAQQLGIDVAYRFSDYGDNLSTNTYKIGADWAPVEDIRFRASFQRAIRAANIVELFSAQSISLFDLPGDPCGTAAPNANATRAKCIATGVPAAVFDDVLRRGALDSPAGQYNTQIGGNPAVTPEESDTVTVGIVFTPDFIPGLTASIDYYDIKIDKTITTFGADNSLQACYNGNDPGACSRIRRNPANGSLWIGSGNVQDLNINIGSLVTKGFDVQVGYNNISLGNFGKLSLNLQGTKTKELITDLSKQGGVKYECVGFYSTPCGTPTPSWRSNLRAGWKTPWKDINLALTWRHMGSVERFGSGGVGLDGVFPAVNYLDLAGSWAINDKADMYFGINNLTDKAPPISANVGTTGNGNTYPQAYESLGRYLHGSLTWKF